MIFAELVEHDAEFGHFVARTVLSSGGPERGAQELRTLGLNVAQEDLSHFIKTLSADEKKQAASSSRNATAQEIFHWRMKLQAHAAPALPPRGQQEASASSMCKDINADLEKGLGASSGVSLAWKDLCVKAPVMRRALMGLRSVDTGEKRVLLDNARGFVRAGECLAVMGPSGSGKTTLLDCLAMRVASAEGQVLLGGAAAGKGAAKRHIAYVAQEDRLCGVLTVRENLRYSAMLRLPSDVSAEQREKLVEDVIAELGLRKCADTKVGNAIFRGVSGGERRRTSIGMELITRPSVLLLDEPTSGLDASGARAIARLLSDLARNGPRVVVAVIHQPSAQVLGLFDKMALLSRGRQVYFGPTHSAVDFFRKGGVEFPELCNPAEIYLDVVNTDFDDADASRPAGKQDELVQKLVHAWAASDHSRAVDEAVARESASGGGAESEGGRSGQRGFLWQFACLVHRTFICTLRDIGVFWARMVMYSIMAVMMGTLYLRMGHGQDTIQDRISVLFFSVAFLCFMAIAALPAFLQDRAVFAHERRNSYYTVGPYALARIVVGIPFVFCIALAFSVVSYFTMNLHESAESFFYFLLVLTAALVNSEGIVTAISAIVPNFIVGIAVGAGLFGMFMLVCGFFLRADNIPGWWIWMHYLVFHKYAFEGFMANEFAHSSFACARTAAGGCFCMYPASSDDACVIPGRNVLAEFKYENVHMWAWFGILCAMAAFYSLLFYVFLRFFNKGNRK
eukprot:m51a1_g10668 hypothetical protein (738) ;mRNA; r:11091-13539